MRNDLVQERTPRGRPASLRFERATPNDLWQIDATRFLLEDETEVWVIDILDDHARFCLAARVAPSPTGEAVWSSFESAISSYGLPRQVLSDNALCFTGRLHHVEVEFERRLERLGVKLIHSRPYHPETLGKLERFHRTLKEWMADFPLPSSVEELQSLIDVFRSHYNEERPHQALDDETPAERYAAGDPLVVVAELTPPQAPSPRGRSCVG